MHGDLTRACHDGRVSASVPRGSARLGTVLPGIVPTGLTRRTLFTGAGLGAALVLAACTSGDGEATSSAPSVPQVATSVDPLAALVATTRLHVLNLQAAIAVDTERQALLTQLLEDRQAHLDAMIAEWGRTDPPAASAQASISGQVPVPADVESAIAQVRTDASDARVQFTDVIPSVSRHRAALLGSIAANLETHRVVLAS